MEAYSTDRVELKVEFTQTWKSGHYLLTQTLMESHSDVFLVHTTFVSVAAFPETSEEAGALL